MAGTTPIVGARYLTSGDAPAIHTATENLGKDLEKYAVGRFASTGARDTAIPAPVADQLCMVSGVMQQYVGSSWRVAAAAVGPWVNLAAAAGWTASGARYRIVGDKVELDGFLTKNTPPITVAPAAAATGAPAPAATRYKICLIRNPGAGTAQSGLLLIDAAGAIQVGTGVSGITTPSVVMLDGVDYLL